MKKRDKKGRKITSQKNLLRMLASGKIRGGQVLWIDLYSDLVNTIAGTITTRIDTANNYWVAIPYEEDTDTEARSRIP